MTAHTPALRRPFSRAEPSPDAPTVDLGRALGALWRARWDILVGAGLGLLAALVYVVSAPKVYRATATVMLETRQGQVIDLEGVIPGLGSDSSVVATEAEVLRSRSLLGTVVDTLELTALPEFNPALRPPGALAARISALLPTSAPVASPDTEHARNAAIDALRERLVVATIPGSLVFELTVSTGDPALSRDIANTLAEAYVTNQLAVKFQATEQATGWLSARVAELKAELEAQETEVKRFQSESDLVDAEGLAVLNRQLKDLRDRAGEIEGSLVAAQAQLTVLEQARSPAEIAAALEDPQLMAMAQRAGGSTGRASFDRRAQVAEARLRATAERFSEQLASLTTAAEELDRRIGAQSDDLVELEQMQREAEASRLIYEYFLGRLKETSVQQGIQQADSRVLSLAVLPQRPAEPRAGLAFTLLTLAGAAAAGLGALWRNGRDTTFRTPDEIETATGVPVLGTIPRIRARLRAGVFDYLSRRPRSAAAEAVRNLRSSVFLARRGDPPKVIVTTSTLPGEGKTTLSVALAQNIAAMGRKVLLIEGDQRRRVFGQYFRMPGKKGLATAIAAPDMLASIASGADTYGFDILQGEAVRQNAADIYASDRFRTFLDAARAAYDTVIVDTPPVLAVADARIIAQSADAVLFIVRWDETRRTQVAESLRLLETVSARPMGIVLNGLDARKLRRQGYDSAYGSEGTGYYQN